MTHTTYTLRSPRRRALELKGHGKHFSGETAPPKPWYTGRHRASEVLTPLQRLVIRNRWKG